MVKLRPSRHLRRALRALRRPALWIVTGIFACAGALHFFASAQTYGVNAELENSSRYTGFASYCNDSRASGGRAIKFGPTSSCDGKVNIGVGNYSRIYNPHVGTQQYYVNDHSIIYDEPTKTYHIIGIQHRAPATTAQDEQWFGHAVSTDLTKPESFVRKPDVMTALRNGDEDFIWAPHIIKENGTYYMFYNASRGTTPNNYDHNFRMKLATSTDLYTWKRVGTLFQDGFDARDPFVTKIGDQWVMYYCATVDTRSGENPIVAYRTSPDLINWSGRQTALVINMNLVYSESPMVWQRNGIWYMFVQNSYGGTPYNQVTVFQSLDPFKWKNSPHATIYGHASEIIQNHVDGRWYITRCGWNAGGVYLAALNW